MRSFLCFLWVCFSLTAYGNPLVYEQLKKVNQYWESQPDIDFVHHLERMPVSYKGQIRFHLSLVEKTLRARNTGSLSKVQQENRARCLQYLHEYWQSEQFPVNDQYAYRTPIFIDPYDNFCAVGYLLKASGHEAISRMIASKTNLAYVREMQYPQLLLWAKEYGFTVEELAWIQPAYGPVPDRFVAPVGQGTDGEVQELFADNTEEKLYVGGIFSMVDGSIPAQNIAYVTETNGHYTWHPMGSGINGPVYALEKYGDKIFAAGNFTEAGGVPVQHIAYWDGTDWHAAGCIYGTVYDLAVYNGNLYAAGDFDVCAALAEVNFAKWDGTSWQQLPGIDGTVHTMEVTENGILLGGNFSFQNSGVLNVIHWDSLNHFQPFSNGILNEVRDFESYHDTIYAVCKRTSSVDSILIQKLENGLWVPGHDFNNYLGQSPDFSCNTLVKYADTLLAGGSFQIWGAFYRHSINLSSDPNHYFIVDSAINVMTVFKDELVVGGKFNLGNFNNDTVSSIARQIYQNPLAITPVMTNVETVRIYPNPAASTITLEYDLGPCTFRVWNVNGQSVFHTALKNKVNTLELPPLPGGVYFAELSDTQGNRKVLKLVIK